MISGLSRPVRAPAAVSQQPQPGRSRPDRVAHEPPPRPPPSSGQPATSTRPDPGRIELTDRHPGPAPAAVSQQPQPGRPSRIELPTNRTRPRQQRSASNLNQADPGRIELPTNRHPGPPQQRSASNLNQVDPGRIGLPTNRHPGRSQQRSVQQPGSGVLVVDPVAAVVEEVSLLARALLVLAVAARSGTGAAPWNPTGRVLLGCPPSGCRHDPSCGSTCRRPRRGRWRRRPGPGPSRCRSARTHRSRGHRWPRVRRGCRRPPRPR